MHSTSSMGLEKGIVGNNLLWANTQIVNILIIFIFSNFECRTKVSFGRTVLILNKDYESDRVRDFV